jgi:hypothetical protein
MRALAVIAFWIVTIIACGQIALQTSATQGGTAFIACALCYLGAAGFAGSVISRRRKHFRLRDIAGIGFLAAVVVAVGAALMMWSGFSLRLFDFRIAGVAWAIVGALSALFVVRPQDAFAGDISPKTGRRA